jgi:hypothetical protein
VEPQSIPAGPDVTAPDPLPDFVTVSVSGLSENVAVTSIAIDALSDQLFRSKSAI